MELEPVHLCRCPINFLQEPVKYYTSMLVIFHIHQDFHQVGVIGHFEMRTSNLNSKRLDLTYLTVSVLVLDLIDLGFVRETIILKTWNI